HRAGARPGIDGSPCDALDPPIAGLGPATQPGPIAAEPGPIAAECGADARACRDRRAGEPLVRRGHRTSRRAVHQLAGQERRAVFTRAFAETHPSQPNYLALFSGSTQGVTDDSCPHTFAADNLARALLDAGRTFTGYSEGLPSPGYSGCSSGSYARKHNPWAD